MVWLGRIKDNVWNSRTTTNASVLFTYQKPALADGKNLVYLIVKQRDLRVAIIVYSFLSV